MIEDSYTIVNLTGRIEARLALAVIMYSAKELRAQHVVIDNLTMLLSVDNDSSGEIQEFVGRAVRVTAHYGCHTHLVAHIRKPKDKAQVPDRHEARGTGSAADQVDNVICVWRNEAKEDKQAVGDISRNDEPDALLVIDKQRETGQRRRCGFDFYQSCGRFVLPRTSPEPMIDPKWTAANGQDSYDQAGVSAIRIDGTNIPRRASSVPPNLDAVR
jgi:twinkle protein